MARILQSLARASLNRSAPLAAAIAFLLLFPLSAFAAPQSFTWRGQTFTYSGAELKWSDPARAGADDSEPILIFKELYDPASPTSDSFFKSPMPFTIDLVALAGGGAGGTIKSSSYTSQCAGGGGAGELVQRSGIALPADAYSVFVGPGAPADGDTNAKSVGKNGFDSYIIDSIDTEIVRVYGGGGGGAQSKGQSGGSGGGGAGKSGTAYAGGSSAKASDDGQGFGGGTASTATKDYNRYGAGGGGAGGKAANVTTKTAGGAGGVGATVSITGGLLWFDVPAGKSAADYIDGSSVLCAGGGGGGTTLSGKEPGAGGKGGGGKGGGEASTAAPEAGTPYTGSGGGAGGRYNVGAAGGCGVVIVRITAVESAPEIKTFTWQGKTITYSGAELAWSDPTKAGTDEAEPILVYKTSGIFQPPVEAKARILAVGGGGAGGVITEKNYTSHSGGGGGGAGELFEKTEVPFGAAKAYSITVGAGGLRQGSSLRARPGGNGRDSSIILDGATEPYILVKGGGGGGGESIGSNGGSGGGGSYASSTIYQGGTHETHETGGKGTDGGDASERYGAGGGGAGDKGEDGQSGRGGNGGDGVESDIVPSDIRYYAGGGGGGTTASGVSGTGGKGGGGKGARDYNEDEATATPGEPNTGSGGGGGGPYKPGMPGGSGIVIIRITSLTKDLVWTAIEVDAGGNKGTIFVGSEDGSEAATKWLGKDKDFVITYTAAQGGLSFVLRDDMKLIPEQEAERAKYAANIPVWAMARILAVGGGGGGGFVDEQAGGAGGGGGAGGLVEGGKDGSIVFNNDAVYNISVGRGGTGADRNGISGNPGGASSVTKGGSDVVPVALGGGGGGAQSAGGDGGSGGGGSRGLKSEGGTYERAGGKGTQGQGFDGGRGAAGNYTGAGGGGAGGAGGNAILESGKFIPGDGGAGVTNNITGDPVVYAAGGGGAYVNAANLSDNRPGGAGGSDGVGGHGAGVEGGVDKAATQGMDGRGGGGGGGTSHAGATTSAGRGGHGVVIIRLSGFVVKGVPYPEANNVTYDGMEHRGAKDSLTSYAYELSGDVVRSNANVYAVTATLKYPGMVWKDSQDTTPYPLTWRINQLKVDAPTWGTAEKRSDYFTFGNGKTGGLLDEERKLAVDKDKWQYDDATKTCAVTNDAGMRLPYCVLTDHVKTNAGSYAFIATLVADYDSTPNVTNFVWRTAQSGKGPMDTRSRNWTINQATNEISSLTLESWQEGLTNNVPVPSSAWKWQGIRQKHPSSYPTEDKVTYQWRPEGAGDDQWSAASTNFVPPKAYGPYELRAYICKDSNHTPGNWRDAEKIIRFYVWRHPSQFLTDYVDFTYSSANRKPITIQLQEGSDSGRTGLPGFTYARADPDELRFIQIPNTADYNKRDEDRTKDDKLNDRLLAYTNVTWDAHGVSEVRVMLPPDLTTSTTKFRMYWHRRTGAEIRPDILSSTVSGTPAASTGKGLVSQMQSDGQPSWVNWWTAEPTIKRYWDKNELTVQKVDAAHGSLKAGVITNMFTKMPEGRPVDFPTADEVGAYIVKFTMLNMDLGVTGSYPGRHLLFDGTRSRDLEIVDHAPSPIDPGGPEGATRSGRVLTANDDSTNTTRAVALQSYWRTHETDPALNPYWRHVSGPVLDLGLNIRPKATHALCLASDDGTKTNDLWILHEVYIGNMMTNDAAASGDNTVLSNRWNTLPWSETSKAITAKDAPFNHTEVGQLLMRNRDDADIESGVFTNGVGTLYFDAVNAYALSDVKPADYRLVVEYDDPMTDGTNHWRAAQMTVLSVNGTSVTKKFASTSELSCLDVKNGGKVGSFKFYRVYAKLDRRKPTRVRIRRVSIRKNEGGMTTGDDDPDGFIVLDNIVVSWPAPVPRIVPTGSYDATRLRAKAPVLGTEGAFSIAYPAVGETFYANVRLEGGMATNVASARFNYRWRYADTEFRPERQSGRDTWDVGYFNVTGETFSTMAPIPAGAVVGDIEYWFDLTAFAPYYTYTDYTGRDLGVLGYCEEPPKNMPSVADPAEYLPDLRYPSHGTNWFVRLREWTNPGRGWWLLYKTAADGEVKRLALEMTDAREWRACLPTRTPLEKLYVRLESESPAGTDAQGIHFTTNLWAAESSAALPKRLELTKGSAEWATVPSDAKSGHLMFLVSEEEGKESVMVSRADWQDFNLWTSGVNTNGLFAGSSVDTNATSSVTQESEADLALWPVSVATNSSWTLKFDAPGQVAAVVYPRYEPFSSKYVNGWTVENGMWTYGQWSKQNAANALTSLGDDSALQMTGRGYGRLSFTEAAKSPDGLDTVSYKARVAQFNEFENVTYYNTWIPKLDPVTHAYLGGEMSIDMTDYTFATCAALTAKEGGAALYDGDGSVSLFAYYRPKVGAYEFRVSRGWNETAVRLALYRWRSEGGAMVCEKLLDPGTELSGYKKNYFDYDDEGETGTEHQKANINRVVKGSISPLGGLFISVTEKGGATLVTAGLRKNDVSVVTGMEQEFGSQCPYACIVYKDAEQDKRLTAGSFGVLACNCPGVFVKPLFWKKGLDSATPSANNILEKKPDQTFTFTDAPNTDCRDDTLKSWAVEKGRTEKLVSANNYFGFQAKAPLPQKVVVQIAESGTSDWKDVKTNTVNGFTSDSYPIVVRDARKCSVRLQSLGKPDDVRADVVLDDIELTQWNGQWTEHWNDGAAPWHYLTNSFVYTSAWIVEDGRGMKAVKLQPTRARNASTPVSLRSSLLRGLGLIHFKWRNADPRAKIRVQYKENVPVESVVAATETLASGETEQGNGWVDLETIPVGELGRSGSHTSYINHRYHGKDDYGHDYRFGLIRLVVDADVEAEAVKTERRRDDPEYGAVEITEAFARDLPEYDRFSWSGWNFRTAGWDGADPDEFANLTDGFRGLSGLLNNTLDESTLADRVKDHYNQKMPGIQSPTFLTNCIGAVSFRARLYGKDDLFNAGYAAVVTVLGTSVLDENGEPKANSWMEAGDVIVSNRVYGTHSVKIPAVKGFKAIRLVVKGVEGVTEPVEPGKVPPKPHYDPNPPLRVAIDDICIWERQSQSIAFRKLHVRPFRDATAIKGTGEVKDITERTEQPLIGESFGFQAEVDVLDPEEVLVDDPAYPITVDLWYYQGGDVWGYENWKTNPAVVKVAGLTPATDGNGLVFRSTVEQSASLCPPQFLEEGEGYRIVQYHVVAHFYDKGHVEGSHDLLSDEWSMPSWNEGFPDPNGTNSAFSAFTLLEEIAPGRAWINEINYCEPSQAASLANQWIELAVPSGVDMTGWTVEAYDYNGEFVAELATLGLRGAAKQKTYRGTNEVALASHYAFYTIKSPYTVLDGADAVWPSFDGTGALNYSMPYAFALRRPTGVIEHRVVAQGWNQYRDAGYDFAWMYDGTNLVKVMHGKYGGEWTWSAEDFHGSDDYNKGVSVITNQGFANKDWVSPLRLTPGEINGGQYISPDWYILPNGGYVKIYSSVLGAHMRQIIGGVTNTVGDLTISQGLSTNIVYEVDRWYKLGPYTVNPSERTAMSGPRGGADGKTYYTLALNQVSNRIDITVRDDVSDEVTDMLDPKYDAYRPAIMKWLERGVTGGADGGEHPFKNPNGPLKPMHYRGVDGSHHDEMNLPDLYWLDVDPTDGDWELWGGMGDRPDSPGTLGQVDCPTNRVKILADGSTFIHTNHLTTVWLELRNDAEGLSYPPYRIQGLGNEQSDLYTGVWTSGNFKVTMELRNGKVDNIFQPMRYFVFGWNSFRPKDDPVSPYAARIEIVDPFSDQSPASEWGWKPYSDCGVFTSWALDGRVTPGGVSTLKKDDLLEF